MAVKNIVSQYKEMTKKEVYAVTHSKSNVQVKDLEDGKVINPVNYILYDDENKKGECNRVLAIIDEDGTIYTSISETLREDFLEIVENFGMDFECKKYSGMTNAGREFVTVEMC